MCRATSDNPATLVTSYFTLATHSSMQVRETRLGDVSVVPRRVKVALEDVHDVDESEDKKYFQSSTKYPVSVGFQVFQQNLTSKYKTRLWKTVLLTSVR